MNKEISTFDANLEKNIGDFMEAYKMVDVDQIYSNGTEFVPIFRVKQWLEYNDCTPEEYNTMTQSNMKLSLENDRLNNIIKNIKEEIEIYIDITIDHLETSNEEINFKLRNKCRAMREIKEEIINIIHKELKGDDNNER